MINLDNKLKAISIIEKIAVDFGYPKPIISLVSSDDVGNFAVVCSKWYKVTGEPFLCYFPVELQSERGITAIATRDLSRLVAAKLWRYYGVAPGMPLQISNDVREKTGKLL